MSVGLTVILAIVAGLALIGGVLALSMRFALQKSQGERLDGSEVNIGYAADKVHGRSDADFGGGDGD